MSGISMSMVTTSGLQLVDLGQRDPAVRGDPDDLDRAIGAEDLGDQPADDDGVVDDEHPGAVVGSLRPPSPTSASFSARPSAVIGFVAYSSAPAIRARTICAGSLSEVTITISETSRMSRRSRTARMNVSPSITECRC